MNKNLRLKIEDSITLKQLSENLLLVCLASLNEKINYTNKASTHYLEKQRDTIAKAALQNGMSKDLLIEKINCISQIDYPTLKQIQKIVALIENHHYSFVSGFIPDKMIHYKTAEELHADLQRKPKIRKQNQDDEALYKLCDYIGQNIIHTQLTDDMIEKIKSIKTSQYSYEIILTAFKWYESTIKKSMNNHTEFENTYDKFCYLIGIIKKKLPDTIEKLERNKQKEFELWEYNASAILSGDATLEELIALMCDDSRSIHYQQHDFVRNELNQALERLKNK